MTRSLMCAVAAFALLTGSALAQEAPKPGGEAGERKLPPSGEAPKMAPGAPKMPGAQGGAASPGMKPNPAAEAQPGERRPGENAGVEPKKPGKAAEPQSPKAGGETQKAGQPAGGETKPGAQGAKAPGAQGAKAPGAARPAPKLTTEQSTRVETVFKSVNVRPVHVDFNVNVGVAVPRTVVLEPVPPEIVTIVPGYEGFEFFVVPGEIVIVDPYSLEIVAVLPL